MGCPTLVGKMNLNDNDIEKLIKQIDDNSIFLFSTPPEPNLTFFMGEGIANLQFQLRVNRTPLNRLKYWLFFRFFPFKLIEWKNIND